MGEGTGGEQRCDVRGRQTEVKEGELQPSKLFGAHGIMDDCPPPEVLKNGDVFVWRRQRKVWLLLPERICRVSARYQHGALPSRGRRAMRPRWRQQGGLGWPEGTVDWPLKHRKAGGPAQKSSRRQEPGGLSWAVEDKARMVGNRRCWTADGRHRGAVAGPEVRQCRFGYCSPLSE